MYEGKTYDVILEEMLDNVPNTIDKREGSIIYDALAPIAIELAQVYADMDMLIDETFADSASYYYLIKRAAEHGVFVKEGTSAVLEVVVQPTDLQIEMGTEFNVGELNYAITDSLDEGHYLLTCNTAGTEGNNTVDDVIPMEYIEGLESIEVWGIYTAGTDDEDEESLRERYIESFRESAFGGNKADYQEKVKNIAGVGGCKVYSAKDLGLVAGNVVCVITNDSFLVPDDSLLFVVQETMDPTKNGSGNGIAPCGHIVTIQPVSSSSIDVTADFTLSTNWDDVKDSVASAIESYLNDLRKDWDENDNIIVRRSKIETLLLDVEGIVDIENVSINENASNFILDKDAIPILGSVMANG